MAAKKMVEVIYKCHCMSSEATVEVSFRRPGENIGDWMRDCVGSAIYLDHRHRSPLCQAATMEYAKLPAPENAPFIGAKPEVQ